MKPGRKLHVAPKLRVGPLCIILLAEKVPTPLPELADASWGTTRLAARLDFVKHDYRF